MVKIVDSKQGVSLYYRIDRNLIFILNSKTFFSKNLLQFEDLTETSYSHNRGDVVTFNKRLTAIAGDTSMVEVYEGGSWNYRTIQPIGNIERGKFQYFTSLVIQSQLYVFGNILVFNQD